MVGHGGMSVDMVLEKELRRLHLDPKAAEITVCHTNHSLSKGDLKAHPTVTHFLQQGHTYFVKSTPPSSATPYEAIFFQTRIVIYRKWG